MNSKQRKQHKKQWSKTLNKLADYLESMIADEKKGEILTKTDLKEMADALREILN